MDWLAVGRRLARQVSNHSHEETTEPLNPLSPRNRQKTCNCTFFFHRISFTQFLSFWDDEGENLGFLVALDFPRVGGGGMPIVN